LKIFLVNKVEREKLSKRIEKFFKDENYEDVFCILKAFRNKVAHGGINASISLNDNIGGKLGNVTFKQSSLIYKSMIELQIEIIDTWFLTKIKL
jgi:hypothetical protein